MRKYLPSALRLTVHINAAVALFVVAHFVCDQMRWSNDARRAKARRVLMLSARLECSRFTTLNIIMPNVRTRLQTQMQCAVCHGWSRTRVSLCVCVCMCVLWPQYPQTNHLRFTRTPALLQHRTYTLYSWRSIFAHSDWVRTRFIFGVCSRASHSGAHRTHTHASKHARTHERAPRLFGWTTKPTTSRGEVECR